MKEKKEQKPYTPKQEVYQSRPNYGCPYCGGSKIVKAPAAPGFEGKPTFDMPCQHCK